MRVAAIYDIHANLPALEAVLQEVLQADVDQIVVGGDVVPGPMPSETIQCLLDLDLPRGTKYPQAQDFAASNVLQPPSERETLESFARAELEQKSVE